MLLPLPLPPSPDRPRMPHPEPLPSHCRVAIVHDQLYTMGGAEQVLKEILACFPQADLFVLFDILPEADRGFLAGRRIVTSGIQRFPWLRRFHRHYFPFMPLQIEQLDLKGYDVVISSSYLVAKGVVVGPDQFHLCYIHSPMRYAWDMQFDYLREMGMERGLGSFVLRRLFHRLRIWDARTAAGVDRFVANSHYIARRVLKTYRREATVIYPPVDVERLTRGVEPVPRERFFLTVTRLVPYKRVDLIVRAFADLPDERLVVIGDGPQRRQLEALAGPNVTIMGRQSDAVVRDHFHRAEAFVYAAEEDFGIVPVEAQACGTPVIAYGRGGACETVRSGDDAAATGLFFDAQTPTAVAAAVRRYRARPQPFGEDACRRQAAAFDAARFRQEILAEVAAAHAEFRRTAWPCPPEEEPVSAESPRSRASAMNQ